MLFRKEALAGQQQTWLGSIELMRPLSMTLLTALALGSVVLVGVFLSTAEYSRKARVSGHLVPDRGVLRITAAQPATVLSRPLAEGAPVKAGDVLFVLSLDAASDAGEGVAQSLAQREQSLTQAAEQSARLSRQQQQDLLAQAAAAQAELDQLAAERRLLAERLASARQRLAGDEDLARQRYISAAQLQQRREELLGLQAQAQQLEREHQSLRREQLALQAQARELPLRQAQQLGLLERERAALQALNLETEARRRLVLRAPSDGVLSTVQAEPGQSVPAAMALATVLPDNTRMQARLYAPSSAVGFVRPGQTVRLRYQAFPYQKFGHQQGRVLQVARSPLSSAELAAAGISGGSEPLYRITVELDRQSVLAYGEEQALSAGMQLDADVLLERRRLIEWIFEPLLALGRRV